MPCWPADHRKWQIMWQVSSLTGSPRISIAASLMWKKNIFWLDWNTEMLCVIYPFCIHANISLPFIPPLPLSHLTLLNEGTSEWPSATFYTFDLTRKRTYNRWTASWLLAWCCCRALVLVVQLSRGIVPQHWNRHCMEARVAMHLVQAFYKLLASAWSSWLCGQKCVGRNLRRDMIISISVNKPIHSFLSPPNGSFKSFE